MLDELRRERDFISLEANSGSLESATERLPTFLSKVRHFLSDSIGGPMRRLFARADIYQFARHIQKVPYTELRPVTVRIPAGLRTDALSYARDLLHAYTTVNKIQSHVLQPYHKWLQQKLGNPESLASLTGGVSIPGLHLTDIDGLQKRLNAHFMGGNGPQPTMAPYGSVYKRNQDWNDLASVIDELEQEMTMVHDGDVIYEVVKSDVEDINDMVERLMNRVREDKAKYKLSPVTVDSLAKLSYAIGRELEFFGLVRRQIHQLSTSTQANMVSLAKHIK